MLYKVVMSMEMASCLKELTRELTEVVQLTSLCTVLNLFEDGTQKAGIEQLVNARIALLEDITEQRREMP
ncbi:MAG: hypothetical protein WCP15_00915 [bacterium]